MSISTLASATPELPSAQTGDIEGPERPPLRRRRSRFRFATDRGAVAGLVVIGIMLFCAIGAPILAPYSPTDQTLSLRAQGPSGDHPLGMDGLGRDQLSQLMFGARYTLGSALAAV